ncbi:MAG: hypothetical protein JXA21_04630 [Anaerolineae bacterium]|nr:hypothetical protein [Anaerolineae bacterium]
MSLIEYTAEVLLDTEDASGLTTIMGTIYDFAGDTRIELGKLTAFLLDVSSWELRGESIFDLFDQDVDLPVYYQALFGDGDYVFEDDVIFSDILIINNLQIKPYFRGLKIGLAAVYQTMEIWGRGCSIVAIKPFPLHFTHSGQNDPNWFAAMDMGRYPTDLDEATSKLKRYYAQLGFVDLGASPVMYLNRDMRQPSLKDIGFDSMAVMRRVDKWGESQ